jgi:hypothetical protein
LFNDACFSGVALVASRPQLVSDSGLVEKLTHGIER